MRDVGVGVGCKWWGKVVKNVFIRPRVLKKAAKKNSYKFASTYKNQFSLNKKCTKKTRIASYSVQIASNVLENYKAFFSSI